MTTVTPKIRVLIASDSSLTRDGIGAVLNRQDDIAVTGTARTREELEFALPHCDVLLITPRLEQSCVRELIAETRSRYPDVKIVLVATEADPEILVSYLQEGANGYVLGDEPVQSVVKKVRASYADQAHVSPDVAAELMSRLVELAQNGGGLQPLSGKISNVRLLTKREHEVLSLVSRHYTNQRIAAELVIAPGTAKNHVHNILGKLEVSSRLQAADIYQLYLQEKSTAGGNGAAAERPRAA